MKLDLKELISKLTNTPMVVESGTSSNGWSYRKWSDGTAECWRMFSSDSFAPDGSIASGIYYRVLGPYNFPTNLFNATPNVFVDVGLWNTGLFWGSARNQSKTSTQINLYKNSSGASSGFWSIYAIGTWK